MSKVLRISMPLAFIGILALLSVACGGSGGAAKEAAPAPQAAVDLIPSTPFQATVTTLDGRSWNTWYKVSSGFVLRLGDMARLSLPGEPTPTPEPTPTLAQQIEENGYAQITMRDNPDSRPGVYMLIRVNSEKGIFSIDHAEYQSLQALDETGLLYYLLMEGVFNDPDFLSKEMKNILGQLLALEETK